MRFDLFRESFLLGQIIVSSRVHFPPCSLGQFSHRLLQVSRYFLDHEEYVKCKHSFQLKYIAENVKI